MCVQILHERAAPKNQSMRVQVRAADGEAKFNEPEIRILTIAGDNVVRDHNAGACLKQEFLPELHWSSEAATDSPQEWRKATRGEISVSSFLIGPAHEANNYWACCWSLPKTRSLYLIYIFSAFRQDRFSLARNFRTDLSHHGSCLERRKTSRAFRSSNSGMSHQCPIWARRTSSAQS